MKLKFSPYVAGMEMMSYAKEETEALPIDCADGCNPYGCSAGVMTALKSIQKKDVFEYPHGFELKDAVIRSWESHVKLERSMLYLTSGGIEGIAYINTAFASPGAKVVGIWPQFTNYVNLARCSGLTYVPVPLRKEENYKLVPQRIIDAMDEDVALIYLDSPNNPTGQSVALADLRRILESAQAQGICVVVDEAYGDYLEKEASAMTLLREYDNLLVIRTFSKGLGLAGMRIGYLAASDTIMSEINKLGNPYCGSGIARKLALAALEDEAFVAHSRAQTHDMKQKIRACIGGKLHMAETLDTSSICFLYHDDAQLDLAAALASHGVKAVSGSDFEGMGINTVRMRMPAYEMEEKLLQALKALN